MVQHDHRDRRMAILVIDEDRDLCNMIALALRGSGYHPIGTTNLTEALSILRALRCDLILADASALAVGAACSLSSGQLLAAAGGAPVVLCADRAPGMFGDFAARGFAGVLGKPFDAVALLDTVRFYLAPPRESATVALNEGR